MIKRNGIELTNQRTNNVKTAKEIIDICKAGRYISASGNIVDIQKSLQFSIDKTMIYDGFVETPPGKEPIIPAIEVVNETAIAAVQRMLNAGKDNIVALNFANGQTPGGGFLSGAIAQEEDLCRASGLYVCIEKQTSFYNKNILLNNNYCNDSIIYSPNVPFFRNDNGSFLENSFPLSIITAPAPNLRSMDETEINAEERHIEAIIYGRAIKILQIAFANGHKNIILGAWGCGAFRNNPVRVAELFKSALKIVPAFENVCFAIWDTRDPPFLFETFKNILGK